MPDSWLEPALALAYGLGGVGVCRAHSGTVLGLLFAPERFNAAEVLARVRAAFLPVVRVWRTQLSGGGVRLNAPEIVFAREGCR